VQTDLVAPGISGDQKQAERVSNSLLLDVHAPRFKNIVTIAPDVGASFFLNSMKSLRKYGNLITLYAASNDYALRISEDWNGTTRAGTGGSDQILVDQSMQSIDVVLTDSGAVSTRVRRAYWDAINPAAIDSHSYFYKDNRVLTDLRELLVSGLDASNRKKVHLRAATKGISPMVTYWEMPKS
jgi:esterase/lipase superfamily enzyme